ncbi:HAD family hydrolase [Virgibacillus oceani]
MKAIIFDFDGTVADTLPTIYYSFQTIFKQFDDVDVTDEDVKSMFGPSEVGIINDRLHYKNKEKAMETFYSVYADSHAELVKENQEIQELLEFLQENRFKLGVVTGKGRKSLDISLEMLHLASYFDITIAGDEVDKAKPHPEGIHKAMGSLHVKPEESMYIGDSDADIKAGNQAGVTTIGVEWLPDYQAPEFTVKPDRLFKDIAEFREFVQAYLAQ